MQKVVVNRKSSFLEQMSVPKWSASRVTKFGLALSMRCQCVVSERYKFSPTTQQPDRVLFPLFSSLFHMGGSYLPAVPTS